MDFSCALSKLKKGSHVSREGWCGPYLNIQHFRPDYALPCICLVSGVNQINNIPWRPGQADMLAEDWMVVD